MEYLTEELLDGIDSEVINVPQNSDWKVSLTESIQKVEDTFNSTLKLHTEVFTYPSNEYQ